MDPQKRIDTILETIQESIQNEVTSLLGVEFLLTDTVKKLATKTEVFNSFAGKQICGKIDVGGEIEGSGGVFVGIKDAILLAGTLIMLSSSELDEMIGREEYGEEIENAYNEIVNIFCSSFTSVFRDIYQTACHFTSKMQEIIVPVKVDINSDEPVKNENFHQISCVMSMDGTQMGQMVILLPAAPFDLQLDGQSITDSVVTAVEYGPTSGSAVIVDDVNETNLGLDIAPGSIVEKHKIKIADILDAIQGKVCAEMGELLGLDVRLIRTDNKVISKKDFFSERVSDNQIIANIDVAGEIEDRSFVAVSLKDAVWIGGKLIMIPDSELQVAVNEEHFNLDTEDAYSEIANLFPVIFATAFEKEDTEKIRFVKTGVQQVVPMNVEPKGDEPIPDQDYYVSSLNLVFGENKLVTMHMLFPARMLQLECLEKTVENSADKNCAQSSRPALQKIQVESFPESVSGDADDLEGPVDILLIGDDENEVAKLRDVLGSRGYVVRVLSLKDNVHNFISRDLKAVYLVTRDVNEQAFGVAIKVSSACSVPIIAAAPGWTKTKVMKAVKYGVRDILLTPANKEDIEENIANNFIRLAA